MKAVILAGGHGTRLAPYTATLPKPLVPVGDVPILEIIVRQLIASGFTSLTLTLGHMGDQIRAYFAAHPRLTAQIDVQFVDEEEPTGTAGSLRLVPNLPETFLVMNGDILTTIDYRKLLAFHIKHRPMLTIAGHRKEVKIDLGVLELSDQTAEVHHYIEKPIYRFPVSMGVYVYHRAALDYLPEMPFYDFPDLVLRLLENKRRVLCYESDARWLDIGRHEDYMQAQEQFSRHRSEFLGSFVSSPEGTHDR